MSKRPPLCTTGKIALAGKRNRERQLLDREQRERDRRDLLSLVGKNSSLAVSSGSGQGTPSRDERYAARIASAKKACSSVAPSAVSTDDRAQGILDASEKIVFDGDGFDGDGETLAPSPRLYRNANALSPSINWSQTPLILFSMLP